MGIVEVVGAPRGGGPSSVPSLDLPRTLSAPALRDEAQAALHADAAATSWMRVALQMDGGEQHTQFEVSVARGPIHSCPNSFRAAYHPDSSSAQAAGGLPPSSGMSTARSGPFLLSPRASPSSPHVERSRPQHQPQPQPQLFPASASVAQWRRSSSATSALRRMQGSAQGAAPRSASARPVVEEAPRSYFEELALAAEAAAACSRKFGGGSRGSVPGSPRGPADAVSAPMLMQLTSPSSSSARLQLRAVRAESLSSSLALGEHRPSSSVSASAAHRPASRNHGCLDLQASRADPERSSSTPPRYACFATHASRAATAEGASAARSSSAPANAARGYLPPAEVLGLRLEDAACGERQEAAAGCEGGGRVDPPLCQSELLRADRFDGLLPVLKPRLSHTWTDAACSSEAHWGDFNSNQQTAAAADAWVSDGDTAFPRQSAGTAPLQLHHHLERSLRGQRYAWGAPRRRGASSFGVRTGRGALAEAFLHASIEGHQQVDSVKEGPPQGPPQGPTAEVDEPRLGGGVSATVEEQQRGGSRALEMEGFVKSVQSCISRLIKSFPAGFELHNGYGCLQVPGYWVTEIETVAAPYRQGMHAHEEATSSEGGEGVGLLHHAKNHPPFPPNQQLRPPCVYPADSGGSERSFFRCSDAAGVGGSPLTAVGPEVFFAIEGATPEECARAASCYYSIEALVGRGAHGAVFRAKRLVKSAKAAAPQSSATKVESEDAAEGDGAGCAHEVEVEEDEVALKILDLDGALRTQCADARGRAQYIQRVMTEANVLSQLEHENIVKFYEAFQWPPCYLVLVTEYLPGGSLRDLFKSSGPLPEAVIARVLKDVTMALDYLHDSHVEADGSLKARCMHRDVKAANILLTESGRAKLIDFGVSTMFLETDTEFAGTPQWMAPEVAQIFCLRHKLANGVNTAGEPPQFVSYNCSVDIWSLGITAYELAMGCLPWPHGTKLDQLMHMIAYGPAPRINLNEGFERSFCYFVGKCLRKNAHERSQASELLSHDFFTKFCSGKRPQSLHELREAVETFNGKRQVSDQEKPGPPHSSSSLVLLSDESNEDKDDSGTHSGRPQAVSAAKLLAPSAARTGSEEGWRLDSVPPAENGDQQSDWASPPAQRPPASLAPKEWPVCSPKSAARLLEPSLSTNGKDRDEPRACRLPVDSSLSSSSTAEKQQPAQGKASKAAQEGAPSGGAPSPDSLAPSEPPQPSQSFFSFFLSAFQGSSVKRESTSTTDLAATPLETHADSGKSQQAADAAAPRGKRGLLDKCANVALHGADPPVGPLQQGPLAQIAGMGPPPPRRFRKTRIAGIRRRSRHGEAKSSLQRGADRFLGFFRRGGGPSAQDGPSSEDSKDAQSCSSEAGSEQGVEVDRGGRSSCAAGSHSKGEHPSLKEESTHYEGARSGEGPAVDSSSSRDQATPKQPLLSARFRELLESPTLAPVAPIHSESPHAAEGAVEFVATESPVMMHSINERFASENRRNSPEPPASKAFHFPSEQPCSSEAAAAKKESREGAVMCTKESGADRFACSSVSGDLDSRVDRDRCHEAQSVAQLAAEAEASSISQSGHGPPGSGEQERGWLSGPSLYKRLLDGIVQFVDSSAVRRPPVDREALPAAPTRSASSRTNPSFAWAPLPAAAAHAPGGIAPQRECPILPSGSSGPLVDQPAARESRASPQPSWLWNLIYREQQSPPSNEARSPSFIAASYPAEDTHQQPDHFQRPQWTEGGSLENAADLYAPVGQTPTAPSRNGLIPALHEYHTVEAEETPPAGAASAVAGAVAGPPCPGRIETAQIGAVLHEGAMLDGNMRELVLTSRKSIPVISTAERIRFTTLAEDLERQRRQQLQSVPPEYCAVGLERGACFSSAQQAPPNSDLALLHALLVYQHEPMVQHPVYMNPVPVQYVLPARYPPEYVLALGFSQGGLSTFVHNNAVPAPAGWEEGRQVVGFPVRWAAAGGPPRGPPSQALAGASCDTQEFLLLPAAHHHPAQP